MAVVVALFVSKRLMPVAAALLLLASARLTQLLAQTPAQTLGSAGVAQGLGASASEVRVAIRR
jgi:hypothetical protein